MAEFSYKTALILGAGSGISASVERELAALGVKVALAARNVEKLKPLSEEIEASALTVDAANRVSVAKLFDDATNAIGDLDIVIYNASARAHGPLSDIDPSAVERALAVTAYGGFLAVHHAALRMVGRDKGAIFLTGATASVTGFAHSAAFAMGKFALRGLAQSAARELGGKGIHVAHFIIDGAVRSNTRLDRSRPELSRLR